MMTLEMIDEIDEYNDLLIVLEAQLDNQNLNREILIREIFVLWYVSVEGINCESFDEHAIEQLLKEKYGLFQRVFIKDSDFLFIVGWMMNISPWYFSNKSSEDDGLKLLYKAYKLNSKNLLYRWALRDHLNLGNDEVKRLNHELVQHLKIHFNYGPIINGYFYQF